MNPFRHEALMYAGLDEFVERCADFVRAGLAAGEPTLVMVRRHKLDLLRDELGADAEGVQFANMEAVGSNPARIIPAWRDFADAHPGRRLRGIGEPIWPERSPAELVECQRHESLINLAFTDAEGFLLLCPYDTDALPADVIEEARRSHPCIADSKHSHPSPDYRGLEAVAAPFDEPLPEPAPDAHELQFDLTALGAVRDFVAHHAQHLDGRAEHLVLAANEAATNSLRHGGGAGVIRLWNEEGALICEIRDEGRIDEPLAGRLRPPARRLGGRGVWMMNQLCDLVQMRSFEDGNAVRLHVREPTKRASASCT